MGFRAPALSNVKKPAKFEMGNRGERKANTVDSAEVLRVFKLCSSGKEPWPLFRMGKPWHEEAWAKASEVFGEERAAALFARLQEYEECFFDMERMIANGTITPPPRDTFIDEVIYRDSTSVVREADVRVRIFRAAFPECPREVYESLHGRYCWMSR